MPKDRAEYVSHIIGRADIAGASRKRGHPHFFVGNAVGANDGQRGKITMQALDVREPPVLDVENYGFGMVAGNVIAQFLVGAGYMN